MQREDLPVCQKYLMRREQTDISCVFPEAGLGSIQSFPVVSSFGLLHLKVSLPHPTALCLHPELVLIVSCPPLHFAAVPSVVFLHVHRTKCVLLTILCSEPHHTSQ